MSRRHTPTPRPWQSTSLSRSRTQTPIASVPEDVLPETKPKLTREQFTLMFFMCSLNFIQAVCFSLLAPFFPREATKKGLSSLQYSIVFAEYEFVNFAMTLVYGKFINTLGAKFLYYNGLFVLGVTAILFGFVDKASAGVVFLSLCLVIRFFEGLGGAAFTTASYTIASHQFQESVSTTLGTLEVFNGLGVMLGPTIGGILYEIGGFGVPFFTLGGILLVAVFLSWLILPLPEILKEMSNKKGVMQLFKIPSILISALSIMVGALSLGFMDPSLEPHLEKIKFSPLLVGVAFFALAGPYSITSPIWGYLSDKKINPKILGVIGCLITASAFLLLGPANIIPLKLETWLVYVSLIVSGIGIAGELIPPFGDSVNTALMHGYYNNFETYALISSFNLSLFSFGSFLGPLMGGVMVDALTFEGACTVLVFIHLVMAAIFIVLIIFEKCQKRTKAYPDEDEDKTLLATSDAL